MLIAAYFNMMLLYSEVTVEYITPKIRMYNACVDVLLLFLPFIFIRKKFVIILPFYFLLITIVELANILYYRNFNDVIPATSYFTNFGLNSFVIDSSISSLKAKDLLLVLTNIVAFFAIFKYASQYTALRRRVKIIYVCVTLMLAFSQIGLTVRRQFICFEMPSYKESWQMYLRDYKGVPTWRSFFSEFGMFGYILKVFTIVGQGNETLNESELAEIKDFLRHKNRCITETNDSIFKCNRNKNLILIVVESLNAKAFELEESNCFAPTLMKLSQDSSVIFANDVQAQTSHGRSSDGQFIYNTGMLPLSSEALVIRYASADYPSIAKTLEHASIEIIGEPKMVWSHQLTTSSFGYDNIIDGITQHYPPIVEQDSLIFEKAMNVIDTISRPFYMQITTIGMHKPYEDETGVNLALNNEYDIRDKHYLEAIYAFDCSLAHFIYGLKEKKIYDDCIIVIASDHEEKYPELSPLFNEKRIVSLIINSGYRDFNGKNCHFNQIDLFPTILDVMGYGDVEYRGVGRSMLCGESVSNYDLEQARWVSEKIIRSGCPKEIFSDL